MMMPGCRWRSACMILLLVAVAPRLRAQDSITVVDSLPGADALLAADTVTARLADEFGEGALRRLVLGAHHRELWNTELRVPVLDLRAFADGLTPYREGGGAQTYSLRLRGGNGRTYVFRVLEKDPTRGWSEELRRSAAAGVVRDQMSALHPAAALVVSELLNAAGVLHAPPRLVWMPDDSLLGEWRARFGRRIGLLEERPSKGNDSVPGFAGADRIDNSEELFDALRDSGRNQVDARSLLAARLMDLFVGDWDRHPDNWVWAGYDRGERRLWRPVARDRDWALSRLDGIALAVVRQYDPRHVSFGDGYGSVLGLTLAAQAIDRRLLTGLEWPVWDSVSRGLQARLTDSVIAAAVGRLPPELYGLSAPDLRAALARRRDRLPEAAAEFYRLLAGEVAIYGTDKADRVTVRHDGDHTDVTVVTRAKNAEFPSFSRRFLHGETTELRLYLFDGDDTVTVTGTGRRLPRLRVVGGGGDDHLAHAGGGGAIRLYDRAGGYSLDAARDVPVTHARYRDYRYTEEQRIPPRDWGTWHRIPVLLSVSPDVGLFLGSGVVRYRYGFRQQPYASRIRLTGGYAFGASTFRAEFDGEWRYSHSPNRIRLLARGSGIEVVRFHGFGNETTISEADEFYRVLREQFTFAPSLIMPLGGSVAAVEEGRAWFLSGGPVVKFAGSSTGDGRFIDLGAPYGSDAFGQVGATAELRVDTRDRPAAATRGIQLGLGGSVYPAVWDVEEPFGEAHAEARTHLTAMSVPFAPSLMLRAGGRRVWGEYPFHEAAYVGGASTVRGLREQRYAGDAAAFGSAELRLSLLRAVLLLPAEAGIFGLADAGRVWLDGESSSTWHHGLGGGLWVALLDRAAAFSAALVRGEDRTGLYISADAGF